MSVVKRVKFFNIKIEVSPSRLRSERSIFLIKVHIQCTNEMKVELWIKFDRKWELKWRIVGVYRRLGVNKNNKDSVRLWVKKRQWALQSNSREDREKRKELQCFETSLILLEDKLSVSIFNKKEKISRTCKVFSSH